MVTRMVEVGLTDDEQRARGEELARLLQDRSDADAERKQQAKDAREALERLDVKVAILRDAVRYRKELRRVECDVVGANVVRTDTGEIVGAATEDERQRVMFPGPQGAQASA